MGQGVHALDPDSEYEPMGQSVHTDTLVDIARLENFPAIHWVQEAEPSVVEYVPTGQAVQLDEPALEKYPGEQDKHEKAEVAPVIFEKVPA